MGKLEETGQVRYHSNFTQELVANLADELMIANFLKMIEHANLIHLLSEEERETIRMVAKNHVVLKANFVQESQIQMENSDRIGQVRYHNNFTQELIANQADELMIANFIDMIKHANLIHLLTDAEREKIRMVVKSHVVLKAKLVLEAQKQMLEAPEQTMKI